MARRKIETVGERWQERIRQQVQDLNMAPPHQYAEVLERLLKLEDVCAIQSRSIRLLEDRLSATERGPLRTPTISESLARFVFLPINARSDDSHLEKLVPQR